MMERFIVIAPHTEEECKQALAQVLAAGFITHFEWGCKDGEHTGWAILEAENAKEAMMAVPPAQRHSASIVRLTRFSPTDIEAMHRR
jgi:ribulose bisphosphate carboxylase small subunit